MRAPKRWLAFAAMAAAAAAITTDSALAQSIESRVAGVSDGVVLMSFAAREGVCGDGRNIQMRDSGDDYWISDCEHGPVRVAFTKHRGDITDIDAYVGGRWRSNIEGGTDLGVVSAPEAAAYFMSLVTEVHSDVGKRAMFPALLADSVEVWPELLDIAKDRSVSREIRKSAVFWVGQAATAEAVRGLSDIVDHDDADREVKEHAVFALSQLPDDEGVPILVRVARTHESPAVRKRALFWLGQSDDPRALALFEEILLRRP